MKVFISADIEGTAITATREGCRPGEFEYERSRREMTVRQVGCIAYGMGEIPADTKEFVKLKMVMSKTFSCLEYLRDRDLVIRSERDGTFYWQSAEL